MGFYDEMKDVADELFDEFQQGSIVLVRKGLRLGPAWKPTVGGETPLPLQGVALGVSKKYVDKGLAIVTDKQVNCAVPSVMPTMEDSISIDGQILKIVHIAKIPEAGTTVALQIIVRAA